MPKMKTSRAAAKRFKKTGTGKLVRNKAYKSHILTKDVYKRQGLARVACAGEVDGEAVDLRTVLEIGRASCRERV